MLRRVKKRVKHIPDPQCNDQRTDDPEYDVPEKQADVLPTFNRQGWDA
jgi:hypothetical protein